MKKLTAVSLDLFISIPDRDSGWRTRAAFQWFPILMIPVSRWISLRLVIV